MRESIKIQQQELDIQLQGPEVNNKAMQMERSWCKLFISFQIFLTKSFSNNSGQRWIAPRFSKQTQLIAGCVALSMRLLRRRFTGDSDCIDEQLNICDQWRWVIFRKSAMIIIYFHYCWHVQKVPVLRFCCKSSKRKRSGLLWGSTGAPWGVGNNQWL